ncbi:hypothetical protein DASB73_003890 [Starmerella bacillaris]|uniref:DNA-directed RNA polymerase III subunit RPC9 n=1 Tax=Starmerella bacillaris TaxID=1247836 RepID=A0AAV5RDX4_STABA|nr:hypothetical protein DASB73_003890 [Starmerella bacillaris]
MKVLEKSGALLCNQEVSEYVKLVKDSPSSSSLQNLQTICVELRSYLKERPANNPENPQTAENLKAFSKELKENDIKLEKTELLQVINSAPDNWPVLYCLIEEADIRFSEAQLEKILELSQKYLGSERVPQ